MQENDTLLTTKEAAEMLGFKKTTLDHWRVHPAKNFLPFTKLPNKLIRYKKSDVEAFFSNGVQHQNAGVTE
jgi:excisionase family DNA binding protein